MSEARLRRDLRLRQLFSLGFGSTVGVGWIIVAGSWIQGAGPIAAVAAFLVGGVVIALIAACYAEAGAMLPHAGGEVVYTFEAFGPRAAYAVGWMLLLSYVATCSFEAISLTWLLAIMLPATRTEPAYHVLGAAITYTDLVVVFLGVAFFGFLNYVGSRSTARVQEWLIGLRIVLSITFIAAGILGGDRANLEPLVVRDEHGSLAPGFLGVLATVPLWYCGFNAATQALGEVGGVGSGRRSGRALFGVILAVVVAVGLFYSGIILATSFAAPRSELLGAELPVAAAMEHAFRDGRMVDLVLFTGLIGLVTAWNAIYFAAARVVFAFGRSGIIPPVFGRIHPRFGTPVVAVVFIGAASVAGALMGRSFVAPALNIAAIGYAVAFTAVGATVIRLRRRDPHRPRPFRVAGYPVIPAIATAAGAGVIPLALWTVLRGATGVPAEIVMLGAWLGLGAVLWGLGVRGRRAVDDRTKLELLKSA